MEPIEFQITTDHPLAADYGPPPAWQTWPAYQPPPPRRSKLKVGLGGIALAGLLVVAGAATVFAADPSPSPSTSPGVTTPGTTTPGTHSPGNCPHRQNQTPTNTMTSPGSSG